VLRDSVFPCDAACFCSGRTGQGLADLVVMCALVPGDCETFRAANNLR
jgi:hypothetical protein